MSMKNNEFHCFGLCKRMIKLMFVVCIIIMMIIAPAVVSIAHAEHEHEVILVCRSTSIPKHD